MLVNINQNTQQLGMGIIGLGILFLLFQVIGFSFAAMLWPLWILVPGLVTLYIALKNDKVNKEIAILGTLITTTGLILATMNTIGHWEAWAYVWALYPTALGLTFSYAGRQHSNAQYITTGKQLTRSGLYMFIGFGLMFELFIFGGFSSTMIPVALIVLGAFVLLSGRLNSTDDLKIKRKVKL